MARDLVPARVPWSTLVTVCKSCPGAKAVRRDLKRHFKDAGRRDVRVVLVSCLDVCPKRATTVAAGSRVLVAGGETPAAEIARALVP